MSNGVEHQKWRTEVDTFRGYTRGKMEEIHTDLTKLTETVSKCNEKFDKRITILERRESERKGIAKAISFLWAAIGGIVVWLGDKLWTQISNH